MLNLRSMSSQRRIVRADMHLHSRASNVTDYYAANVFSIPESYSDPFELDRTLRERGMDLVTLTDHNSIDGVRELRDRGLPGIFLSSELTARFPEDGCHVHITVTNVSEAQFAEANRLRHDVYELIAWLDQQIAEERAGDEPIAYFMTHPLMSTQNRPYGRDGALRVEHIEKMLLLCDAFEVHNGARTRALNTLTKEMLGALEPGLIERLADRHGLAPKGETPWQKAVLGGSDDHAGINPGRTWTEFECEGTPSPAALVRAIRARRTRAAGVHGGPVTLAHALLKLLYDGSSQRTVVGGGRTAAPTPALGGVTQDLLDLVFRSGSRARWELLRFQARGWWMRARRRALGDGLPTFEEVLHESMTDMLGDAAFRARLEAADTTDDRIFLVLGAIANSLFKTYVHSARRADGGVVNAIKALVAMLGSTAFLSLPYFVSFMQHSSDSLIARDVRKTFGLLKPPRLALVTDTFFDVNGVALTIRRLLRESIRRGIALTVVTALPPGVEEASLDAELKAWIAEGRLKLFPVVDALDFPEYDGLKVLFPPLLDMLRFLQEEGFTKMQISTPGTVGVAGLVCAKLLQIETSSTYHTSFPEYVENYTNDVALEALAWNYMTFFYHSVDEVVVPSKFIARLLHKRGLRNRKLLVLDRWTDVKRFTPEKRDPSVWRRLGAPEAATRFIYVGRLGVEKNLALLAEAFRRVHEARGDVHLTLVGDGPFRAGLVELLAGLPVTFTGFLGGDELPTLLASADVKLFPSTTDTWGNAPLEAQSAGLPVVVSAVGGPRELMVDGETGFVIGGRDVEELVQAMQRLCDPALRRRMGANARAFALRNVMPEPFTAILDADGYRESLKQGEHPSRAVIALAASEPEGAAAEAAE